MSSFAIGHGERAVHGRFMYWVSLEERSAAGFAELKMVSRVFLESLVIRTLLDSGSRKARPLRAL